jgi:hypothetical protein
VHLLVAGPSAATRSANDVAKTAHAMYSLKAAMKWDEDVGFFSFKKIIGFDIKVL